MSHWFNRPSAVSLLSINKLHHKFNLKDTMGFLFSFSRRILEAALVFFLIIYLPGLPPYMDYTPYSVASPMPMDGPLAPNTRLNNAEHLFEHEIHGPECFAAFNGELYTGLHGGQIVKISNDKIIHVAKLGQQCDGFWDEHICGRPLGMKFDKDGNLYVADAYYGIYKINVKTNVITKLVSTSVEINGKVPQLPNSVDVASDGTVYWTDSSTDMKLCDGVFTLLGDGTGRLLKYDPKTNTSQVLLDNLHFANGVVLSLKEDYVLVAETQRSRIHRYYLKGAKKGTFDIFVDGLPGLPDNLKSDNHGGYYVPLVLVRDEKHPVAPQVIGPYPFLRKFLARLLALIELPFKQIEHVYPNYYTKRAVHWIGHFESLSFLHPKQTSILHFDGDGKVIDSFHSLDGSLTGISEFHIFNGAYYLGSPYNHYIGRVKMQEPERVKVHVKTDK